LGIDTAFDNIHEIQRGQQFEQQFGLTFIAYANDNLRHLNLPSVTKTLSQSYVDSADLSTAALHANQHPQRSSIVLRPPS
jgi:hypothetical protein